MARKTGGRMARWGNKIMFQRTREQEVYKEGMKGKSRAQETNEERKIPKKKE